MTPESYHELIKAVLFNSEVHDLYLKMNNAERDFNFHQSQVTITQASLIQKIKERDESQKKLEEAKTKLAKKLEEFTI